MKALRNDREAHHVIAWGGCMNPNRLKVQHYKPEPQPQPNAFQRLMRKIFRVDVEPTHRAPFLNDPDMGL